MERLKVFEGIPPPYDKKQRMVVPQALRVLRLKPGRKYCTVGRLAHEVGWKYQDVVARYVFSIPVPVDFGRYAGKERTANVYEIDSRREERSRATHTTRERRSPEDNSPRHRRHPATPRRKRSWPLWATRTIQIQTLFLRLTYDPSPTGIFRRIRSYVIGECLDRPRKSNYEFSGGKMVRYVVLLIDHVFTCGRTGHAEYGLNS